MHLLQPIAVFACAVFTAIVLVCMLVLMAIYGKLAEINERLQNSYLDMRTANEVASDKRHPYGTKYPEK